MANKATDHQYSLFTLRNCKIRKPPSPDWKERRDFPSVKWPEDGSIDAAKWVYSDNPPIDGADGYKWWNTLVGWIRADGLELKYDKVPSPTPPTPSTSADLAAMIAEVEGMIIRLTTLRAMLETWRK